MENAKGLPLLVLSYLQKSYTLGHFRKWTKVETIMAVTDAVRDVAFAPNLGRSYHMLAIASKDVRIVTLKSLR